MFHGSIVALVTPMKQEKDNVIIDYNKLSQLVDWHLKNGTDGIVVLGTTGESPTVSELEREKIITQVVAQVSGRIPVIVGTGTNSTTSSIALTQQALGLGADAALIVTPYYNKPNQQGLVDHYSTIASQVSIPIILYNVPCWTGCDLLAESVVTLSKISNIVARKEATGDLERARVLREENLPLDLLSGDDITACEFMLLGGKGVISVTANVAPKLMKAMCKVALEGQTGEAKKLNKPLVALHKSLFIDSNPIPVKWAMAHMGLIHDALRLPLTVLSEQHQETLDKTLKEASIL